MGQKNAEVYHINEQLIQEQKTWSKEQWRDYYTKDGIISIDELYQYATKKVIETVQRKYGNNSWQA